MGQREEVRGVGFGTVRMGRREVEEMGGLKDVGLVIRLEFCMVGAAERETVLVVIVFGSGTLGSWVSGVVALRSKGREGSPEMMGGGRLRPSAALRESCRAKSEACHHSRNLRANIEVGRRILRLERTPG